MISRLDQGVFALQRLLLLLEQHLWLEPKRGKAPWQMHLTVSDRMINLVSRHGRPQRAVCRKRALTLALGKADQKPEDMRYLFAGDLLGQLIASSFGLKTFEIPLFGLYGACSTCGEALALSAMTVAAGYADRVAAVTSSHLPARKNSSVFRWNTQTSVR